MGSGNSGGDGSRTSVSQKNAPDSLSMSMADREVRVPVPT